MPVKVVRWFSEPVLVIGSFLVVLGAIALINGGSFRAAATLTGEGEPIAKRAESVPVSGAIAGAPGATLAFVRVVPKREIPQAPALRRPRDPQAEPAPVLGIIFDDAWLLLVAGTGVLLIGKGLRLVTEPDPQPALV